MEYHPIWYFVLEDAECRLRSKKHTPIVAAGAALNISPKYPYWLNGNCLHINTEDSAAAAFTKVPGAVEDLARDAISQMQAHNVVKPAFILTHSKDANNKSRTVANVWKDVLVNKLGLVLDGNEESFCMGIKASQLKFSPKAVDQEIRYVRATIQNDFAGVLDVEPGGKEGLEWRTVKCQELLSRSESEGLTYLCYLADVSVARFLVTFVPPSSLPQTHHVDGKKLAFVTRVNTKDEFQRRGYAKQILEFGLKDLFENYNVETVVLFADEEGPIALYKGIGFEILDSRIELNFELKNLTAFLFLATLSSEITQL
ncbi:hypothetical protein HK100_012816 [Physocladia obscura]|uniref:N-acetyltransferase domain-containing protein n=1 Tax=Physocladia obscura TaxID=109957 RepID=A0AAD5TE10_9FUNG|nr:hypothetical protein HK100_012816 [Physocladia obscura]